jgi:hypothetical protein
LPLTLFYFVCVLLEFRLDVFIIALALVCMMGIEMMGWMDGNGNMLLLALMEWSGVVE